MKKIVVSPEDFKALQGHTIEMPSFIYVGQKQVSDFVESTNTKQEGSYVPDLYLLSLTPYLWNKIMDIRNVTMVINYGLPEVRFLNRVIVGEHIRLIVNISYVHIRLGITKVEMEFVIETMERNMKSVEGKAVFLYYFDQVTKINYASF